MNFYLAARYSRRLELVGYMRELELMGHTVTSRWLLGGHQWNGTAQKLADEYENSYKIPPGAVRFAQDDIEDIDSADIMICFPDPPHVPSTSRGGMYVEFGYALAKGKPIVIVGPLQNVFHLLDGVVARFECWSAAYEWIWSEISPTGFRRDKERARQSPSAGSAAV